MVELRGPCMAKWTDQVSNYIYSDRLDSDNNYIELRNYISRKLVTIAVKVTCMHCMQLVSEDTAGLVLTVEELLYVLPFCVKDAEAEISRGCCR